MKKLILFLILLIVLPIASAVRGDSFWIDTHGNEIQEDNIMINPGEEPKFHVYSFDNDLYDIYVFMLDVTGERPENVHNFINIDDYEDKTFVQDYTIQNNFYEPGKRYEIHISGDDGNVFYEEVLYLNVNTEQPSENHEPTINLLYPENNAQDIPLSISLRWDGNDQDDDNLIYNVFLNRNLIGEDLRTEIYHQDLQYDTNYNWYVTVNDGTELVQSQTWNFRTIEQPLEENEVPTVNIYRPIENELVKGDYNIIWNAYDNDGNIINTKIYYKPHSRIPLIGKFLDLGYEYELLADLNDNPRNYVWDTSKLRNGVYSLKIIATDDDNAQGEDVAERVRIKNIVIRRQNHAPEITSQPVTSVKVNKYYSYDVNAIDQDNDRITYSFENYQLRMSIDPNTGVIKWLPRDAGNFLITVRATDEHGAYDSQTFIVSVTQEEIQLVKVHEFNINNVILDNDNQYINVYVKVDNDGSYNENIQLRAINMNTGDITYDSFLIENGNGYWRILKLPKPRNNGVYTIGVLGNSKDYKDMLYREIIV